MFFFQINCVYLNLYRVFFVVIVKWMYRIVIFPLIPLSIYEYSFVFPSLSSITKLTIRNKIISSVFQKMYARAIQRHLNE